MATAHRDLGKRSSLESHQANQRLTENIPSDAQLFYTLWSYTDIVPVVRSLLERLQESWHHHSAFLLQEILDMQILYRNCQTHEDIGPSLVREGALLHPKDVLSIARTVSLCVTANHLENFDDFIIREMRLKLLASALFLSRMLGALSIENADYHWIRQDLITQMENSLRDRSAAGKAEDIMHSFGSYNLFIRYALVALEELPPDSDANDLLSGVVAKIFLGIEHQDEFDLAELLAHFRVTEERRARKCVQPFRALHRLSSEAVSLRRFISTTKDHEAKIFMVTKAQELADWLILKIELLFRHEFARVQRLRRLHVAASKLRMTEESDHFQAFADDADAALDLLHVANDIAGTFGERTKFDTIKSLCRDVIEQSASERSFQPLRMKAVR
ncbi:MAG: hypothetical protein Q9170_002056 [Blastenia crenularia]